MNADERNPEHEAVDGGFECACGATRSTPLGMARHRSFCTEVNGDEHQ